MPIRLSRRGAMTAAGVAGLTVSHPSWAGARGTGLQVSGLLGNDLTDPIGVQQPDVRLSWRLQAAARDTRQTAYQVQAASSPERLRKRDFDLWDSAKISSDQCFDVAYRGKALAARQRAWWQVRVWDNHGHTALSPPAFWEMGLLSPSDWTGAWLAAEDAAMRMQRQTGLTWIEAARPARAGTSRQFRLAFTLPKDAAVTLLTVAGTPYRIFLDGEQLTLPPVSKLAPGNPGAVASAAPLKAGRHVLALDVDDLPAKSSAITLTCAIMVLARTADGTLTGFNDHTARTTTGQPDGWTVPDFSDDVWPNATLSDKPPAALPSNGAFLMRRDFTPRGSVVAARLYATALGGYETYINGAKVGDDLLAPESTDFSKRTLYRVHDVTAMIRQGGNAIGALVGDGWYGSDIITAGRFAFGQPPLRYIAQLELTYADGQRETVATDERWLTSASPVKLSEIYYGEDYDARLEQPGWASPGFTPDARWTPVTLAPPPTCRLEGQTSPPIRRTATRKAQSITRLGGAYVLDFGQNFAGWVRLAVKGAAGDRITLKFAEVLAPDGHVDQTNLRGARAQDTYILKGDPAGEHFEPHFTYHGFRYVEVTGMKIAPGADDITGIVLHSDLPETGHLHIGNPLIQQLWQNTLWSQRSNFMGIPTDCPQRDERLGWMGDANVFWDAAAFNMNVAAFTRRFASDMRDAQYRDGAYANVSPNTLAGNPDVGGGAPGWTDAGVILPWTAWKRFGDTSVIDQHWDSMVRYIDFLLANNPDHIWRNRRGADFGDWLSYDGKTPGDPTTPKDLLGTATWKHSVDALVEMAQATNRTDAAAHYAAMSRALKDAFTKEYVKPDGTIGIDSQTGYILALRYDLIPGTLRDAAAAKLHANILRRGNIVTTGFLGTPNALDVLGDFGYDKTVYDLLLRTQYPSWGYMVVRGATTIWERWNGDTGDVTMNSFNHYALGAVTGFVFRRIAGISPLTPGFKNFTVNLVLDPRVTTGGGDYDSMMGRISTAWEQRSDGSFTLRLQVPANAQARVHLPTTRTDAIREGGRSLNGNADIKVQGMEAGRCVVAVGSGTYDFAVTA